jgi:hypothetical protein
LIYSNKYDFFFDLLDKHYDEWQIGLKKDAECKEWEKSEIKIL